MSGLCGNHQISVKYRAVKYDPTASSGFALRIGRRSRRKLKPSLGRKWAKEAALVGVLRNGIARRRARLGQCVVNRVRTPAVVWSPSWACPLGAVADGVVPPSRSIVKPGRY